MAETKQPYRGTVNATRLSALNLAKHGWPNTADVDIGPMTITYKADGAVKVGDIVGLSTVGKVKIATNTGVLAIGVCVGGILNGRPTIMGGSQIGFSFADGSVVFIAIAGVSFIAAEGSIAIGDTIIPGTSTAGTGKTGTTANSIIGKALTASSVSATVVVLLGRS